MSALVFLVTEVACHAVRYIVGRRFHEISGWPGPVKDVKTKEDQMLDCTEFTLIHVCIECENLQGVHT
jgi:hypothetical protein